jgi:hypothetical protein
VFSREEGSSVIKTALGIVGAAAIVVLAASYGKVLAEGAPKPPACKTMPDEFACKGRDDCQWVNAVVDSKTGKEKRKAYCRSAPRTKKK